MPDDERNGDPSSEEGEPKPSKSPPKHTLAYTPAQGVMGGDDGQPPRKKKRRRKRRKTRPGEQAQGERRAD